MVMKTPSYQSSDALTPDEQDEMIELFNNGMIKQVMLGKKISANMNTTTDQAIIINSSNYVIRRILVTNASASLTLGAGGIYTAASKGGTAVVAAGQVYSALTNSAKILDLTLAVTDRRTEDTLYLSLTSALGSTATADIYIFGDKLD